MTPENERFLKQFENIVNKIYDEQILPIKRMHPINHYDIIDLKMIFGLSTIEKTIDFDKLMYFIKKYG